jgi:uncharacterized protein YutE (UPF0331/DUF86 family)
MYYVNEEQIGDRLGFAEKLAKTCETLLRTWDESSVVHQFAQERAMHLAIETVTDVGSLLIDGFILRDASSYEDIVEILRGESVFDASTADKLLELVKLRKPLVQDYAVWERGAQHPLLRELPALLPKFADAVWSFVKAELGK